MTGYHARLVLSIAMLLQGVGAIASEIGTALRPHCHMTMGSDQGKPAKMPCCHGEECSMPSCSTGCVMAGVACIMPLTSHRLVRALTTQKLWIPSPGKRSLASSPPLRPPIA